MACIELCCWIWVTAEHFVALFKLHWWYFPSFSVFTHLSEHLYFANLCRQVFASDRLKHFCCCVCWSATCSSWYKEKGVLKNPKHLNMLSIQYFSIDLELGKKPCNVYRKFRAVMMPCKSQNPGAFAHCICVPSSWGALGLPWETPQRVRRWVMRNLVSLVWGMCCGGRAGCDVAQLGTDWPIVHRCGGSHSCFRGWGRAGLASQGFLVGLSCSELSVPCWRGLWKFNIYFCLQYGRIVLFWFSLWMLFVFLSLWLGECKVFFAVGRVWAGCFGVVCTY